MAVSIYRVFLLVLCSGCMCDGGPKPLSVLLRSTWGYTPPLLEASEFFREYQESLFWKFVNATKDLYSSSNSDKVAYELATDVAEELLPPSAYNVFLFSLAMHAYSPAVQMSYQVSAEAYNKSVKPASCNGSGIFMDVSGSIGCTIQDLQDLISIQRGESDVPHVYQFDHLFPAPKNEGPLVILYGELGTPAFAAVHSVLSEMALKGEVQYIFRHYVIKDRLVQRLLLSGYGVELSVKSTEYKAVDDTQVKGDGPRVMPKEEEEKEVSGFMFSTLKSRYPALKSKLKDFEAHLLQGAREMPELKLWQLQDLGFQAAQRVIGASPGFGLKILKDLSQNLLTQAKLLYKTTVEKNLRKEIQANQKALANIGIQPGSCVLLLNGIVIQNENLDTFQLLDVLLSESRMLDSLHSLGIESSAHSSLLEMSVHGPESSQVAVDVRGEAVVFINDLEKDRIYRSWPKSLKEFLRPTYPGMLRQIARNVFNIVFMLDPLSGPGLEMMEYVKLFLDHMVPARLGLVLVTSEEDQIGVAVNRGFSFLVAKVSSREAVRWIIKAQNSISVAEENVTVDDVSGLFQQLFSKSLDGSSIAEVFSEKWDSYQKEAKSFFLAKGFVSLPQVLVNGIQLDPEEDLETAVVTKIHQQTFQVQQALFTNRLKDKDNVYDFFMNKPNVLARINRHILADSRIFDLSNQELQAVAVFRDLQYFSQAKGEFTVKELSVWLVVDVGDSQGRQLISGALSYIMNSELVRVAILHNSDGFMAHLVQAAIQSSSPMHMSAVTQFLQQVMTLTDSVELTQALSIAASHGLDPEQIEKLVYSSAVNSSIAAHAGYSESVLGLKSGQNAMLCNGKLIGPFSEGEVFSGADWSMLVEMESDAYAASLASTVGSMSIRDLSPDEDTSSFRSDLVMKLGSLLRSQPKKGRLSQVPSLSSSYSALHLEPLNPELSLHVVAVLDPLSPDTQRLAPVLQTLHTALSVDLTVYLNPVGKLSQMPISRFYRYVLQPELSFDERGSLQDDAVAIFSDLPTSPLLTLGLDIPHSWLAEPVFSPYDLDNIHLAQVPDGGIHAEFTLEHILVEGQCFDAHSEQPTPGLEYVLGSGSRPDLFDTIVMANLGYFQLKAGPGAWVLRLREGKSREVYSIHSYSVGGSISGKMEKLGDEEVSINVQSFVGAGVILKVGKRPGMEDVSLLNDEKQSGESKASDSSNIWSSLSNLLHSPEVEEEEEEIKVPSNETINIFSIASGHLYERFLRIMMLSVLKHTCNPVKFWFLKNYLSPTFKEFIPFMASHYGFDYELVQYKWPRWLHAQTQKQRLIWGYKILFLDVLFPLSVKKIIFVDADQIVRTDLKELLEMPLEGAPYAYTPFCDSRPDMQGFRFWDKGYWKNHLGNRRYHISALYVVDLVTFRQLAAGDRLRGQYQALSQDPNSLSNLDQDLPNNMIHSVPIKSLPQEWLWCETWCSQESKAQAKTIDLCNNPLTKEPKLQSAVRIVPEWTEYDSEVKGLWEQFTTQQVLTPTFSSAAHTHTEL